jgi:hypothetical protein
VARRARTQASWRRAARQKSAILDRRSQRLYLLADQVL